MINVVFCFDNRIVNQAKVAILSLVQEMEKDNLALHVHCLCSNGAEVCQHDLERLLKKYSPDSKLTVRTIDDNPYMNSYEVREITTATYLRLILPSLLPDTDKIIYFDVDLLFLDSIRDIWEQDISDYYVLGVKGSVNTAESWGRNSKRDYWHLLEGQKGKYVNAGVLVMNLAKMREDSIQEKWLSMADEKFYYQDQDIINISCKDKIGYIPPKYNFQACVSKEDYKKYVSEGIFTEEELYESFEAPVIIHYSGEKPWNNCYTNLANLWWDYVENNNDLKVLFNYSKVKLLVAPKNILKNYWKRLLKKIGIIKEQ